MAKICRTCLQKSNETFRTSQPLGDFGGGPLKISIVLRFCMPELYLGLSSNPEICYECKESLKTAYLFKKKCLGTENIIGNYLKNARCTARSVELHDVLAYFDDELKLQLELEEATKRVTTLNPKDAIAEWEGPSEPGDKENSETIEVRQSAPNPTNCQKNIRNNVTFCEETGLFVNPQGEKMDSSGNLVRLNPPIPNAPTWHKVVEQPHTELGTTSEYTRNNATYFSQDSLRVTDNYDNICKISNVFSLSENNAAAGNSSVNKNLEVQIKDEPLEVETTIPGINFNYTMPLNDDPLHIPETDAFENCSYNANLHGIINNIPEISDSNQYVDIPDFVQINNFGLKELEELRQQQQKTNEQPPPEEANQIPAVNENSNSNVPKPGETTKILDEVQKDLPETSAANLPDVIYINGKKMLKCPAGFRPNDDSAVALKILKTGKQLFSQAAADFKDSAPVDQKKCKIIKLDGEAFKKIPEVLFIGGKKYTKAQNGVRLAEVENAPKLVPFKQKPKFKPPVKEIEPGKETKLAPFEKPRYKPPVIENKPGKETKLAPFETLKYKPPVIENKPEGKETNLAPFEKPRHKPPVIENKPDSSLTSVIAKPIRRRRKIKIVPVHDNQVLVPEEAIPTEDSKPLTSTEVKSENKDVVVLFTNYSKDGVYINDHDYLINPYKRNKVLIEEDDEWLCMCYICNTKHRIYEHVDHMSKHSPKCKVCHVDLRSPYLLNVHVRPHTRPCRHCTERVPYGQIEEHEKKHYVDEQEMEVSTKKFGEVRKRGRKPGNKDEKLVYFPIKHEPEQQNVPEATDPLEDIKSNNTRKIVESSSRGRRGRKRKGEGRSVANRVLRPKVKKVYMETDDDESTRVGYEMLSSTGPP